ncbi:MAG: hypothetical protein N4A72_15300 [Bacteroidales bacterium]|jgi:photosystem II stability/assembly factor-like uncharacterized protein|nr:hypothetical protein [Bacteroidales bacterium]
MKKRSLFALIVLIVISVVSCKKDSIDIDKESGSETIIGLGNSGVVIRSADGGLNWTRASIANGVIDYNGYKLLVRDAVYAKDKWIAVGGFGSGAVHKGIVLTSTDDGNTWNEVKTDATSVLYDVEYCGNKFVAAGMKGNILLSTDGTKWTKINLKGVIPDNGGNEKHTFVSVAYGEGTIVAVGRTDFTAFGTTQDFPLIVESTDGGNTWKHVSKIGSETVRVVKYTNQGFIALSGGGVISKKGGVWSYDNRSGKFRIYPPLHYTNNRIFATSGLRGRYSSVFNEGSGWEERGNKIINLGVRGVTYGNGSYLFVGSEMHPATAVVKAVTYISSDNGNTWVNTRESLGEKLVGRHCSLKTAVYAKGRFVIAGDQRRMPGTPTMIFTSEDGTNWKESVLPGLTIDEQIYKLVSGSN